MAELVSIKRNVDVSPGQAPPAVFRCSQGDVGSKIILGLLNNGTTYAIPSGVTVTIEGSESNGSIFTPISATASGSDITFYLTGEMTAVAGPAICQAVLKSGSNILGTANFTLEVESSPMGADAPPVFTDAGWTWMLNKLNTEFVPALGDNIIDAIESKADQSDLTALSNTVAGHTGSITVLNNTVNTLNQDVTENRQNIARKLDKNQGANNSGKYLKVGANGNIETADLDVTTDKTLSIADKAADAKAVRDELDVLKADLIDIDDTLTQAGEAADAKTVGDIFDMLVTKVTSVNLVNSANINTGYLGQQCVLKTNAGRITEFIKVKPDTVYTANNLGFGDSSSWVSWMFESNNLTSKIGKIPTSTFTTPSNCNYVRLVYSGDSSASSGMLVEGDTLPSSYVPWIEDYYAAKDDLLDPAYTYTDNAIDNVAKIKPNDNLWDYEYGRCSVNGTNHTITKMSTGSMVGSGFVEIEPFVLYDTGYFAENFSFIYDANKNYIAAFNSSSNVNVHTHSFGEWGRFFAITNPNAKYVILTTSNNGYDPDSVWIKKLTDSDYSATFGAEQTKAIFHAMQVTSKQMYGKKWAVLGDSITAGDGLSNNVMTRYQAQVAKQCGIIPYNYGVSGSRIAVAGSEGDFTYDNAMVIRYANMISDADYITVLGGINDANNQLPLGTLGDTDIATFYGALEVLITGLLTKYPGKAIGFITYPHYQSSERHRTYVNAIKEACARYAIPVLDLHSSGGMNTMTTAFSQMFYSDGLHPNELGQSVMARKICAFLGTL